MNQKDLESHFYFVNRQNIESPLTFICFKIAKDFSQGKCLSFLDSAEKKENRIFKEVKSQIEGQKIPLFQAKKDKRNGPKITDKKNTFQSESIKNGIKMFQFSSFSSNHFS